MSKTIVKMAMLMLLAACSSAEERKANYLKHGQTYYDQKNYDKASVEVRNALQIDPKYLAGRYLFAQIAERKGDIRAAAGQYLGIIDEHPEFAPARAAMSRLYLMSGLSDEAKAQVEEGLQKAQEDTDLVMMRGAIKARDGKLEEALQDALAAWHKDPQSELTVSLLGSIYKQLGRVDDAVNVVNAGIKSHPDSVDLHIVLADLEGSRQHYDVVERELRQLVTLEPKSLAHRTRLVQFYLFRKQADAAEAVWRQAVKDLSDEQQPKLALVSYLWQTKGEAAATKEMQGMLAADNDQNLKLEWGTLLQRQGRLDAAQQTFNEIIHAAGVKAAGLGARNRLAAQLLGQNQSDQAGLLIADVLKENPRDNDALIMRANMAMAKGDAATAITDLRSVLRAQPNATALMRALARAHLQNNEVTLAEEILRNALQTNPADVDARKDLAQLLLRQNKPSQARDLLAELSKIPELKDQLDVQESTFRAQLAAKDYVAARVTVEAMRDKHGDNSLPYYLAGVLADAQAKPDEARSQYEQALTRQPDAAEPLAALVRLDVGQKQTTRAVKRLDDLLQKNPAHGLAWNLRGELKLGDKLYADAAISFGKAIELMPKWWAPYRGMAVTQLAQQQTDAAIETYQKGIEKTGGEPLITDLAALYERRNQPDDAIKVYQQWVRRNPKSSVAINNLAMLLLNYRQDQSSIAEAVKLAEKLATNSEPAVLDTRGWVKFKSGDYPGAVMLLEQAVRAAPNSGVLRYHLGMAQWKAGDVNAARDNLQAALKSGGNFFGSTEARQTLEQLKSNS